MTYGDFKVLTRRIVSNKILREIQNMTDIKGFCINFLIRHF